MQDFGGYQVASLAPRPRAGQWVLFNLSDLDKQAALVEEGAHAAMDGRLVAIHAGAETTSPVKVQRGSGAVEFSPGETLPARLVLVNADGDNLALPVKTAQGWRVAEVFFFLDSPTVKDVEPLTSLADLPPGRVCDTRWMQTLHNSACKPEDRMDLPEEIHSGTGMTPGELLEHHARALREED